MKTMITEIQNKLVITRSPDELICKRAMTKCLQERDQLITQQHKQ